MHAHTIPIRAFLAYKTLLIIVVQVIHKDDEFINVV